MINDQLAMLKDWNASKKKKTTRYHLVVKKKCTKNQDCNAAINVQWIILCYGLNAFRKTFKSHLIFYYSDSKEPDFLVIF